MLIRVSVVVKSSEIARATLHVSLPWYTYLYTFPFLSLYPLLAYAYYVKYDDWLVSEEWTFLACVSLGAGHALSFLVTKWNAGARAWITTKKVRVIYILLFRLTSEKGTLIASSRLHSHSSKRSSRARRHCAAEQEGCDRHCIIHVQLSTRYLQHRIYVPSHLFPSSLPFL